MLTTFSRRSASATRRASSRSVFAANPAFSFVLRGSTTQIRAPVGCSASTNAHVGPLASTATACAVPTPRAMNRVTPSAVRGNRPSHFRSPVGVMAHAWKNALCKSTPIYSRSRGCSPLTARSMRAFEHSHYLRRRDRATALSFDQRTSMNRARSLANLHARCEFQRAESVTSHRLGYCSLCTAKRVFARNRSISGRRQMCS